MAQCLSGLASLALGSPWTRPRRKRPRNETSAASSGRRGESTEAAQEEVSVKFYGPQARPIRGARRGLWVRKAGPPSQPRCRAIPTGARSAIALWPVA
jgi:hypothetical protein